MKKVLLLLAAAVSLAAQPLQQVIVNPDCMIPFQFIAAGSAPAGTPAAFNNKQLGCNVWQIQYSSTGFSGLTLTLQSAPDSSGVPGAFGTMGGTAIFGVNPNTTTTGASSLINTFGTTFPVWVRVNLSGLTGSGNVTGVAFGIRQAGSGGVVTLSAASVGINSPLGQTTMANGVSVTLSNNQLSGCLKTFVNLSGSGNTQIVALSGSTKIYVCDMEFSTGTPENFKLTEGTGSNCAGGTADVTALMLNISAWSLTPAGAFAGATGTATGGDALCANQSNAQAAGVTIWYIQQ